MLMAHKPTFTGVEETQWGDVAKTFAAYRDGYYAHTDTEKPRNARVDGHKGATLRRGGGNV